ncbi:serine protease family S33, partial [Thraustotheca clavata]
GAWVRDVVGVDDKDPPSYAARWLFGMLFGSGELRNAFQTLFAVMRRCSDDDLDMLESSVELYIQGNGLLNADIRSDYDSLILYYVILSSEHQLFYTPVPTLRTLQSYFGAQIGTNPIYRDFMPYCLFTNSQDPACKEQNYQTTTGFVYKPDSYFNKTAKLPTSLLVLNGALDPITPDDQAKYQFDQYQATNKLFVNISDASHSVVDNKCGYKIYISYLMNDGNTAKVDTSCMADRVANLTLSSSLSEEIFGASNIDKGQSNRSNSGASTRLTLFAFVCIAIFLVA